MLAPQHWCEGISTEFGCPTICLLCPIRWNCLHISLQIMPGGQIFRLLRNIHWLSHDNWHCEKKNLCYTPQLTTEHPMLILLPRSKCLFLQPPSSPLTLEIVKMRPRSHTSWLWHIFSLWLFEWELQHRIKVLEAILQGVLLVKFNQLLERKKGELFHRHVWHNKDCTIHPIWRLLLYIWRVWLSKRIQLTHLRNTWNLRPLLKSHWITTK